MHSALFLSHQNFFAFSHHPNTAFSSYHGLDFLISNSLGIIVIKTKVMPMDEIKFLLELKFISSLSPDKFMNSLCAETISSLSLSSSHPLFSFFVTFCTLVFLYFPQYLFWKIVFSPVLILTGILLLTILRLGAIQKSQHEQKENQVKPETIAVNEENSANKEAKQSSTSPIETKETKSIEQVHQWINLQMGLDSSSCFVEWNVKAPLEVIYEEYEGEEEAGEDDPNEKEEKWNMGVQRCPSLSSYYPETDSDTSSESGFPAMEDWHSPEKICFSWDDEEDREGLIEIALDGCRKKSDLQFHFEEENLIEIDISPTRYKELSGDDEVFSGTSSICHSGEGYT